MFHLVVASKCTPSFNSSFCRFAFFRSNKAFIWTVLYTIMYLSRHNRRRVCRTLYGIIEIEKLLIKNFPCRPDKYEDNPFQRIRKQNNKCAGRGLTLYEKKINVLTLRDTIAGSANDRRISGLYMQVYTY